MNIYRYKTSVLYQFIRNKSTLAKTSNNLVKCGQPTAETHPHLIKPGEIVPNIQISEFQKRRENLMDAIFKHSKQHKSKNASNVHIVVIPSASKKYMSEKIPYVFRQNTDYLYLSGCLEPDSCLVLYSKDFLSHKSTLFVKTPDSHSELWDGPSTSAESAPNLFGVDNALPMCEITNFLDSFAKSNKNCTFWYDLVDKIQYSVENTMQLVFKESLHVNMESPKKIIHQLRLRKSPAEIALMKKSCEIASKAFHRTMAMSRPNITEHQLFATVDYECRMNGAEYLAYPPVVAGGNRATTIHYIDNNQVVADKELVLMDAGCELHGYSSDITRTWPINGKFTPEQKLLYDVVYDVQSSLIKMLVSFPTLDKLFDSMCSLLGNRLQEVGLIRKTANSREVFTSAFQFCPHHSSHYLGMDVHDTSTIPRNVPLQPGMIITVEPGIYISENNTTLKVPKKFQGLGIRIEDDVLITENGPVVLSESCTKDPTSIENIITSGRQLNYI